MQSSDLVLHLKVYGRPQQRGSKVPVRKRGGGVLMKNGTPILRDMNKRSESWMESIKLAAVKEFQGELLSGPIEFTAKFYFQRPQSHFGTGRNRGQLKYSAPRLYHSQPDLSKLMRCAEDALTGIVWKDDRQVTWYGVGTGKYYTTEQECAELIIRPLEET